VDEKIKDSHARGTALAALIVAQIAARAHPDDHRIIIANILEGLLSEANRPKDVDEEVYKECSMCLEETIQFLRSDD
jgi:hypothetical protein